MTEAEYRQLVITHRDRLHTYAAWWLGDVEAAGDVTQDAFLRLWEHHSRVHEAAGRSWLYRTAHRLCIDRHRHRAGRAEVSLEAVVHGPESPDGSPDKSQRTAEMRRVVSDGLGRLSASDRSLLVLREVVGLPIAEIGNVLDQRPGNVKVALHRARQRLRQTLVRVNGKHEL